MNEIEELFLIHDLTGREIANKINSSKSTVYKKLKELGAVDIKKSFYYRFWNKVNVGDKDECWLWNNSKRSNYGAISFNNETLIAHRVSYDFFNDDLTDDIYVCHTCDTPPCVNPNHLFLGTHSDNMIDAYEKGRLHIPEGHRFEDGHLPENAEMSLEKAKIVKKHIMNENREISLKELASKYGIKYQTVRDISAGRSYINI